MTAKLSPSRSVARRNNAIGSLPLTVAGQRLSDGRLVQPFAGTPPRPSWRASAAAHCRRNGSCIQGRRVNRLERVVQVTGQLTSLARRVSQPHIARVAFWAVMGHYPAGASPQPENTTPTAALPLSPRESTSPRSARLPRALRGVQGLRCRRLGVAAGLRSSGSTLPWNRNSAPLLRGIVFLYYFLLLRK